MRFLLLLLLSGCSYDWREAQRLDSVQVTWERVANTQEACTPLVGAGRLWYACTSYDWVKKTCRIFSLADASDETLGHELRHCFGWTHR